MVYAGAKVKKRTSKVLGYAITIICIVILLHVLNPSSVSEVPHFVVSEIPFHTQQFLAHDQRILTFDEGIENIHAKPIVKKSIEKIVEKNVGIVTILTKHVHEDTYIIAFSNGLLYTLRVEVQETEGEKREVITDSYLQLSTTPIASVWYRSFIVVLSTDDRGQAFLHMLKKNKRKNSLYITKTIQVPFAVQSHNSLYAVNDVAVFLHAQNTVYILEKNTLRMYEKNVCSLSSVATDESFTIVKFLSSINGVSCKSSSEYLDASHTYKNHMPFHTTENRIRIFSVNAEWNLFPLPYALSTLSTVYLESENNEYQTSGNHAKHYKFLYTYGDKNYTIALQ